MILSKCNWNWRFEEKNSHSFSDLQCTFETGISTSEVAGINTQLDWTKGDVRLAAVLHEQNTSLSHWEFNESDFLAWFSVLCDNNRRRLRYILPAIVYRKPTLLAWTISAGSGFYQQKYVLERRYCSGKFQNWFHYNFYERHAKKKRQMWIILIPIFCRSTNSCII